MRVITGTARGRKLGELKGSDTRPTTDKVKEAMFNIIQFDIEGRRALDLFAGTGQLGIEALSRGAAHCTFVDVRREAAKLVADNLALCGFTGVSKVVLGDFTGVLPRLGEKFDLIFLDPPYQTGKLEKALELIAAVDIVTENGIMVCESPAEAALPALEGPYEKGREYRYGKIKLTLYHRRVSAQK